MLEVAAKLLKDPPDTDISLTAKFVVGSLAVNVKVKFQFGTTDPLLTLVPLRSVAVMVIVGAT